MKDKKIIILISLIFFSSVLINITQTRAIIRDQTISTNAEKDTYVNTGDALSNFGGQNYALGGFYFGGDIVEAYFFFNFTDKPTSYTKAEISLDFWSVSQTMNISISLIEEAWDEYSMTWINKPSKGAEITSMIITQSDIYTFNVTSYIAGRNNLSICVYIKVENYVDDYFYITSREGFYSFAPEDAPQLIWTYPENAEITVTNPTSSSNWLELSTYTIQWNSTGNIENIKIELYKGATFVEEITSVLGYTANDGAYDFYVSSAENYNGTDYRIKIIDYDDSNVYGYSNNFSMNIRSGTLTVTNPTSSSNWLELNIYTIQWTSTGNIDNVKIELYKGATFVEEITSLFGYTTNDGSYDFYISSAENYDGTNYRIKIINYNDPNDYGYSGYFSMNIRSGSITVTNPTDSSSWTPGSFQLITWISTGTITHVDIDLYKGSILMYYVDDVYDIGTYSWTIPEDIEQGADWEILVSNSDNSGQNDWSEEFTIAVIPNPNAIPGYDLLFIGCLSILTSLVIIRKRLKK